MNMTTSINSKATGKHRHAKGKYKIGGWFQSKCRNCGATHKSGRDFGKWFEDVNWFRGDDELIDCLCTVCLNDKSVDLSDPEHPFDSLAQHKHLLES